MSSSMRQYLPPMKTDGTFLTEVANNPGQYTLVANTTYLYVLGAYTSKIMGLQITGYDSGLVITSATMQDTLHSEIEVLAKSTTAGEWVPETPTTYVAATGTGWSATNSVIAAAGSGLGGGVWHVANSAAHRLRLSVVVGATGGKLRVSMNTKG